MVVQDVFKKNRSHQNNHYASESTIKNYNGSKRINRYVCILKCYTIKTVRMPRYFVIMLAAR